MTWIHKLSQFHIPFVIYKIKPEDYLIQSELFNPDKIFIIIHGIINVTHIYNNQELIPLTVLFQGQILCVTKRLYQIQSYYKYTAINTTYIISFKKNIIHKIQKKNRYFISTFVMPITQPYSNIVS